MTKIGILAGGGKLPLAIGEKLIEFEIEKYGIKLSDKALSEIIKNHKGRLKVSSLGRGKGSMFSVLLPASREVEA